MTPENPSPPSWRSHLSRARDTADRVYRAAARPDRPLGPEPHKKPWLAALISLFLVGAGQLYNRQVLKALLLAVGFYLAGGMLLTAYAAARLWTGPGERVDGLGLAALALGAGVWLFAAVDAYRTAAALRDGRLCVRYGFLKQGAFVGARLLPLVGLLAPAETVAPGQAEQPLEGAVKEAAKGAVVEYAAKKLAFVLCLALGLVLLGVGLWLPGRVPIALGVLALLGAALAFLA